MLAQRNNFILSGAFHIVSIAFVFDTLLFLGLELLALSLFWKRKEQHLLRGVGFVLFGIYWLSRIPHFLGSGDTVNAVFSLLGCPFYIYLGLHAYRAPRCKDERALHFMAVTTFAAAFPYFLIAQMPKVSGALIYLVAWNTCLLLRVFGFYYVPGDVQNADVWFGVSSEPIHVPIIPSSISLIFACTALQSMLIFVGAICGSTSSRKSRVKALLILASLVYILNLVRNACLIYLVDVKNYPFELAHNWIGKVGSLIALLFLAYLLFRLLPDIEEKISMVLDLFSISAARGNRQ